MNNLGRVVEVHKLALIKTVIIILAQFALLFLPDGNHAVENINLNIGLIFRLFVLVIVIAFIFFRFLHRPLFLHSHRNRVANVVGVSLNQLANGIFFSICRILFIRCIFLQIQDNFGTMILRFSDVFSRLTVRRIQGIAVRSFCGPLIRGPAAKLPGNDNNLVADHER